MHGCGVYEVNERTLFVSSSDSRSIEPKIAYVFGIPHMNPLWLTYNLRGCDTRLHIVMAMQGRFYFGELLEEEHGCTVDVCAVVTQISLSLSMIHVIFSNNRRKY